MLLWNWHRKSWRNCSLNKRFFRTTVLNKYETMQSRELYGSRALPAGKQGVMREKHRKIPAHI